MYEKENKNFLAKHWLIILIVLLGLGLFCWYQIRPARIYSACHKKAVERAIDLKKKKLDLERTFWIEGMEDSYSKDDYDYCYKQCLRSRGINK